MNGIKHYCTGIAQWINNQSSEWKMGMVGMISVGAFLIGANYKKIIGLRLFIGEEHAKKDSNGYLTMKNMNVPYYAVIFSSVRSDIDDGYSQTATKMVQLASKQAGFLGVESARNDIGITVSYWKDLDSIRKWKANMDHQKVCFAFTPLSCYFFCCGTILIIIF